MDLFQDLFGRSAADDSAELRSILDKFDKTEEFVLPLQPTDRVRASGIEGFCPRFEALRHRDKIALRQRTSSRLNRIFRDGRTFERALRDKVFGPAGLLVGVWECSSRCGEVVGSYQAPVKAVARPASCPRCRCSEMTYVEPFSYVPGTLLGGSTDGFILWKGERSLLEIKTSKDKIWQRVAKKNHPMASHVSQTNVYMEAFGVRRSLLWYYNKNTSEHLAIWTVKSDSHVQKMVAKTHALAEYFKTGILPGRLCPQSSCTRAKGCSIQSLCFSNP